MGVLMGSCLSALVLCCNIAVVIVGSKKHGGYQGRIAKIKIGTARDMTMWSAVSHLLINVISAPTRHDIDIAHGEGQWYTLACWVLGWFGGSHNNVLLFDSCWHCCQFTYTSCNALHKRLEKNADQPSYNAAVSQVSAVNEYRLRAIDIQSEGWYAKNNAYKRLSNDQGREIYNTMYLTEHGDLVLVIDRLAHNISQSSVFTLSRLPSVFFQ
ncbi:hypothetical protein BU25DRAFT_425383 [Macroventuria anomochaeta]|uniref:Uncharacterized protein n=1 Tax=Macroventuria anomochaeta TaxID=301207 RepID=A0ACB6RM13_9PLEO|nr:uncharacterized protein BU25DRAFT_425383 [Macroventuria anomochaeta]KAF2622906.1 hypothetical protein BU25DRAFT_425383 [Macroventuria anomochaeta]